MRAGRTGIWPGDTLDGEEATSGEVLTQLIAEALMNRPSGAFSRSGFGGAGAYVRQPEPERLGPNDRLTFAFGIFCPFFILVVASNCSGDEDV